jgi:RNA polymerase sigma factor (sigma-70 family)
MTEAAGVVFIVDDDPSMRESLQNLVRSIGLRAKVFASAQDFLRSPHPDRPACLVLDVRMPGLSGLDLQKRMADAGTDIPIIFLTAHADVPMTVRAMKAGAVEFLTKPMREQDLLDSIQQAMERDRTASADRAETEDLRRRLDSLTPREREVMQHVIAGLLNKQIAGELGMSEATVKIHRHHVMEKMKASSVAELVRMADRLSVPTQKS